VHPGVECDRSGMCPIVGTRFHLRGHNYDLCQAEFDKLPSNEKPLYDAIAPPAANAAPAWGWGAGGGRWGGWRRCGGGMGGGNGCGMGGGMGMGAGPRLAARFVRDVTIFDGTQMAPSTKFTKIWRLKNVGEVPWPPGSKLLFVGGDQMTSELAVPLSRAGPVMPNEEVDVAVEMVAPPDLGRYLGYWRLVGPHGRRKFGQRVWCHVQVVDPTQEAASLPPSEAELSQFLASKQEDLAKNGEAPISGEADYDNSTDVSDVAPSSDKSAAAGPSAAAGAPWPTPTWPTWRSPRRRP